MMNLIKKLLIFIFILVSSMISTAQHQRARFIRLNEEKIMDRNVDWRHEMLFTVPRTSSRAQ